METTKLSINSLECVSNSAQSLTVESEVESYKVTKRAGKIEGIGVSVSGKGAWAKLYGAMTFSSQSMESSRTYQQMKSSYDINGGVNGFFSWLGFGANAKTHKEEIQEALKEMSSSSSVSAQVAVDLYVEGIYPNVRVDASAFLFILEIEDSDGNTYRTVSADDPENNTGGIDSSGSLLPEKNNNSTITI